MELVSIITPTYGRDPFLKSCHQFVSWQSWPNVEWLVLDDSRAPSEYLSPMSRDGRITYIHSGQRMSIGAKRNHRQQQEGPQTCDIRLLWRGAMLSHRLHRTLNIRQQLGKAASDVGDIC